MPIYVKQEDNLRAITGVHIKDAGGTLRTIQAVFVKDTGGILRSVWHLPVSALFTTPGAGTWTVPPGVTSIRVELVGAGGGGGSGFSGGTSTNGGVGGGGGGGAQNTAGSGGTNGGGGGGGGGSHTSGSEGGRGGGGGGATSFGGFFVGGGGGGGGSTQGIVFFPPQGGRGGSLTSGGIGGDGGALSSGAIRAGGSGGMITNTVTVTVSGSANGGNGMSDVFANPNTGGLSGAHTVTGLSSYGAGGRSVNLGGDVGFPGGGGAYVRIDNFPVTSGAMISYIVGGGGVGASDRLGGIAENGQGGAIRLTAE